MAKTAIVTGASGGLGSAVAKRLATDGFAITVGCLRHRDTFREKAGLK